MRGIIKIAPEEASIYKNPPYAVPTALSWNNDQVIRKGFRNFYHLLLVTFIVLPSILSIGISLHVFLLHFVFIIQELHEKVGLIPHIFDVLTELTPIGLCSCRLLAFGQTFRSRSLHFFLGILFFLRFFLLLNVFLLFKAGAKSTAALFIIASYCFFSRVIMIIVFCRTHVYNIIF